MICLETPILSLQFFTKIKAYFSICMLHYLKALLFLTLSLLINLTPVIGSWSSQNKGKKKLCSLSLQQGFETVRWYKKRLLQYKLLICVTVTLRISLQFFAMFTLSCFGKGVSHSVHTISKNNPKTKGIP